MSNELIGTEIGRAWLNQFRLQDQERAAQLLQHVRLIGRDEFADNLLAMIRKQAKTTSGPVGLYVEREVGKRKGVPHKLFKEKNLRICRAFGIGPNAVKPTNPREKSVGSEGIVATLVTQLCREAPAKFINHPGPALIRKKKIRKFILVTDLIGSGQRAAMYLQAAWRVRSVRSWWSGNYLKFSVIAYSGTELGVKRVTRHPSKPTVEIALPCPTIKNTFSSDEAKRMESLCKAYDPLRHNDEDSLGFGDLGALIAFAHGSPNNAPRIFHKMGKGKTPWIPLFPARVTSGIPSNKFGPSMSVNAIKNRLIKLRQKLLANSPAARSDSQERRLQILVLASLSQSPRHLITLASRTGLSVIEAESICAELAKAGWIDATSRHLTDMGYGELSIVRKNAANLQRTKTKKSQILEPVPYYPSSLRLPISKV